VFSNIFGKKKPDHQSFEVYMAMRKAILGLGVHDIRQRTGPADQQPKVWGVLMDIGTSGGNNVTIVSLADGTTSMYTSRGGGVLGTGESVDGAKASLAFVATADRFLSEFSPATDTTILPAERFVRFYLLTYNGILTAEAPQNDLVEEQHPLSPLYYSGDDVITQIRLNSPPPGA
jgi:hypothetical protein